MCDRNQGKKRERIESVRRRVNEARAKGTFMQLAEEEEEQKQCREKETGRMEREVLPRSQEQEEEK